MTREQLAKKSASEVRKDKVLFGLYKDYFQQDAHLIYPNGKPPGNCFGCTFNTHYRKWQNLQTKDTQPIEKMAKDNNTYVLKDPGYRVYFKGEILSKNSPADKWKDWINYPKDAEKVKKRKALFEVLDKADDPKPKAAKRKKAEPKTESNASQDENSDE